MVIDAGYLNEVLIEPGAQTRVDMGGLTVCLHFTSKKIYKPLSYLPTTLRNTYTDQKHCFSPDSLRTSKAKITKFGTTVMSTAHNTVRFKPLKNICKKTNRTFSKDP